MNESTPEPGKISPELHAFAHELVSVYASTVQRDIARSTVELQRHIDTKIEGVSRQVEASRVELKAEIQEVKETLEDHGEKIEEQGRDIAVMSQRLKEGDRRMDAHDKRIEAVEKIEKRQGLSLAHLSAAVGTGGALGAAVMHLLK